MTKGDGKGFQYQVIARRYRPRRFDEVVGQEGTAATLRNAILQERLAHAYLFCGPRGIGKTSMARIFARALNCPVAADRSRPEEEWGIPCNACAICDAIHAGDAIDVLEMDGASHRGIEDVRDIIETVKFAPSEARFKIFIVDEVHMLTREAFNALLKVLEEPPAHVKFVFATTEAHKIPDTVLSRCQRFDFHPISEADIVRRLEQICGMEEVKPEPGLLAKIARHGRGGLRDAQTLLDQLISFSGESLRGEDLDRITGRIPEERLDELVGAVRESRPAEVLRHLEACYRSGTDPAVLLEQLVERFRAHLGELLKDGEGGRGGGDGRDGKDGKDGATAESAAVDRTIGCLQILHETAARLKGSPYPELAVEIALVKLARLEDPRSLEEAIALLRRLEGESPPQPRTPALPPTAAASHPPASPLPRSGDRVRAATPPEPRFVATPPAASRESPPAPPPVSGSRPRPGPVVAAREPGPAPAAQPAEPPPQPEPPRAPAPPAPADLAAPPPAEGPAPTPSPSRPTPADFERLQSLWDQILIEFRARFPKLQGFLDEVSMEPGPPGSVVVRFANQFGLKQMGQSKRIRALEELIREVTGADWKVRPQLEERRSSPSGDAAERPAATRLEDDPLVKKSLDLFRGRFI